MIEEQASVNYFSDGSRLQQNDLINDVIKDIKMLCYYTKQLKYGH